MFKEYKPNMAPKKNPMPSQDPKVRAHNFKEVAEGYTEEMAIDEAKRCLGCPNTPCIAHCPVNINIPGFIHQVALGNFEEAYNIISESSSLSAVCGRVCPQETQCEMKCTRGLKAGSEPVAIGRLERFVADYHNAHAKNEVKKPVSNGHKVAVIGSGPSGLTCAGDLAKKGYDVTVFEREERIGGLLRYGIPNFKLGKSIIDRRLAIMKTEGVKFQVGTKIDLEHLPQGFDAYAICTGTPQARDLAIPGRDLSGIHFAMEMLSQQNRILAGDIVDTKDRITAHVLL